MPKCELCFDQTGEPNLIKRTGSMGWCKVHKVERCINDSCSAGEIDKQDEWTP